jgi:hypothetical protein
MRPFVVTIALSAFAFALPSDPPPAHAQPQRGALQLQEVLSFPEGQDRVSLPFENWGEHIVIPVSVNGGPPLQMVFDTGMPTQGVLLYEGPLVDNLKLAYGPMRIQVGGAGGGKPVQARLATDTRLRVGTLDIGGSIAIVMPPTPSMSGLHDGIIGATLFQDLVVTVDHDRNLLTLTKRSAYEPPAGAAEVKLKVANRRAYAPGGLVGADGRVTPLTFILDLGATHPVSLSATTSPAIVVPPGAIQTRTGRGMSGAMTGRVGRIPGFEFGGHRMTQVVATFPDSAFENPQGLDQRHGNLGSGILGRFNVALDFGGERMFIVPNARFREPFEWDMTGLVFDMGEGGRVTVAQVLERSPAADAGIQPGAELVAVDGAPVEPRVMLQQRQRFRQAGKEIALTLRENGRERVVKLKLRRLV